MPSRARSAGKALHRTATLLGSPALETYSKHRKAAARLSFLPYRTYIHVVGHTCAQETLGYVTELRGLH